MPVVLTTLASGMSIGVMGSVIAKRLDEVIRAGLHDTLRADGYRKSARTYHHVLAGGVVRVVNVQASQVPVRSLMQPLES